MKKELEDLLYEIFCGYDHLEIINLNDELISFEIGDMYSAPDLNYNHLKQLADFYGTTKIDVNGYANSGCETCDYGSNYGHHIEIKNPTKNIGEKE